MVHAVNFNLRGRTAVGSLRRYLDQGFVGEICHLNLWWGMSLQHDVRPEVGSWKAIRRRSWSPPLTSRSGSVAGWDL